MTSKFVTYTQVPTYDNLVKVLQVYLNRYDEDTLEAIPFFINAAEKTILRNLRMPAMEKMVSFTLDELVYEEADCFITLPMDFLEMKFVWVSGARSSTLQRVTFDQLIDNDNALKVHGYTNPRRPVWAINANRMYIRGVPGDAEVFMTYYADIPELSEDLQENDLLQLIPDAFLFYSVAEGFRFLMEEQKADYWESQANKRLGQIQQQVADAEFSGSPLVISPKGA